MIRAIVLLGLISAAVSVPHEAAAQYPWPVTPIDESHEITGTFSEYRDTEPSAHFHNGVDIPKADRSPVYAVTDGRVTAIGSDWIRIDNFAYLHVQPAANLLLGDSAFVSKTIVGTILDGQGHVHLTDGQPGAERQPLREDGGLTPFVDTWAPSIENVRFYHQPTRQRLATTELAGDVEITFRVREPNGPPTTSESRLNNGAYKVGYRVLSRDRQDIVYMPPDDGIRFRFDTKPLNAYVHRVYDRLQSSTSRHVYIVTNDLDGASAWDTSELEEGDYTVALFAEDTRGNLSELFVDVTVHDRDLLPPPQPTLLSVLPDAAESTVTWTGGETDDLAGFLLYVGNAPTGSSAQWMLVHTVGPELNTFSTEVEEGRASYIYLTAVDSAASPNESVQTDVYGFRADAHGRRLLIVDGYDRYGGSGSWHLPWHYFAATYGSALAASGIGFETVTNEALIQGGDVELADYEAVFWVLGDESTADQTFSSEEQAIVRAYLEAGGQLFVSGSEIAWDLDSQGTSADRAFIRDYLKVAYAGDDAEDLSVTGTDDGIFAGANLQYGSSPYHEDYPDYFTPVGGGMADLLYGNGRVAGVQYTGTFGAGASAGKVVTLGFPFETISGSRTREAVMQRVVGYFFPSSTAMEDVATNLIGPILAPPYPNPVSTTTTVEIGLPTISAIRLTAYDVLGREVAILADDVYAAGNHVITWSPNLAPGIYFLRLKVGSSVQIRRLAVVQ